MAGNFSRRAILAGLLTNVGFAALAGAPTASMRPVLRPGDPGTPGARAAQDLIRAANLGGSISYVVADAASGQILESMNPNLRLPPASVAKLITAQYALSALGQAHRFSTRLVAVGTLDGGRLDGDLVLLGGGDPTLNTNMLAEMATALRAAGLRQVTGRFLVHGGTLPRVHQIDATQPGHLGYNPGVSGLNLNFNRVYFEWQRIDGVYRVTMDARSARHRPQVAMARMQVVDRDSPVYTYSNGDRSERWTVARSALGAKGARWLPVRLPELYAGEVFQIFARGQGIVLRDPEIGHSPVSDVVSGTVLVARDSAPLGQILKGMLARSNNLTAEVVGLGASVARGRKVSGLGQSAGQMSNWMKTQLGAARPRFVDHSGLGDKSRISASDMVAAMVSIGPDSLLASIIKPIQLRDAKGKPRLPAGVSLRAKTGTLNFVSGLSGFVRTDDRRHLVFAIFTADMDRRAAISLADRERPRGAKGWSRRARALDWGLIERWVGLYG